MEILEHGKLYGEGLKDMRGRVYQVGDKVARGRSVGRSVEVEIVEVTRIENGKMYMGGSKTAVWYPSRMLIVNEIYEPPKVVHVEEKEEPWFYDGSSW